MNGLAWRMVFYRPGKFMQVALYQGGYMVIRPLAAGVAMGEIGRSAGTLGATGGPAAFSRKIKDEVELGLGGPAALALYSASPLFKIMGAAELMSKESLLTDSEFGDLSFLD